MPCVWYEDAIFDHEGDEWCRMQRLKKDLTAKEEAVARVGDSALPELQLYALRDVRVRPPHPICAAPRPRRSLGQAE